MNNQQKRNVEWSGWRELGKAQYATRTVACEPGRRCMDSLSLPAGAQLLDVGCGCGNQTFEWASRLDTDSTITGVDISEPMLAGEELKAVNQARSTLRSNLSKATR